MKCPAEVLPKVLLVCDINSSVTCSNVILVQNMNLMFFFQFYFNLSI